MVCNYIRKTSRGSDGSTALSSALQALDNGQSLKATARQYGIPAKTLRRHRDDKVKQPGVSVLGRHKCVFPPEYKDMLVQHILVMENAFFGLTTMDIRRLAFDRHQSRQRSSRVGWGKIFFCDFLLYLCNFIQNESTNL